MVRPSPKLANGEIDAVREALYGYLIGKDVPHDKLPPVVQAFEAFKKEGGRDPRRTVRDAHRARPQNATAGQPSPGG